MDTGPMIQLLSTITDLSPEFIREVNSTLKQEFYKPRQILHAAGQTESRLYFMTRGFARNYYYDQRGDEHTVKFWEPRDILFSYEGYYKVSSYFYTEIIQETELITMAYTELHDLDDKFPEISILIKSLLLQYQHEEYEKQNLVSLPAEERYQILRKKKPELFQKLPIRIIASYLHMTRETLTKFIGKR
ncbi:Crp/Fnr family transcriptional regulator [Mucilaginibacter sp. L196]|uniref:Crp/Fnr family transcriptional regulator n=1 Tax=Mucilaginibacter sp. L196 TaxID=1641870 RepID=UPI00131AD262|nr:Crp/Fnr family transcriptional regulator [Mucilaginibacter sp. L196]